MHVFQNMKRCRSAHSNRPKYNLYFITYINRTDTAAV